jgi:putative serine protease PepD
MSASTITAATASQFGVPPGLYVESVVTGGPADKAGLQAGDLITRLDGHASPDTALLARITVRAKTGDTVDVEYQRGGKTATTTVTLEPVASAGS